MITRPTHGGNLTWASQVAGSSVIWDFSASINPWGPPASAIAAIQAAIPELIHYPDPNYGALRGAIALHHGLDPAWVFPGNGAAELLTWAAMDLAQESLTALITPAFADYGRACRGAGAALLPCGLDLHSEQRLEDLLPPSALLLNNPHNPTGKLWPVAELLPLIAESPCVVVDEAFMDFLPPGQQQSLIPYLAQFPQLVVLRSLTKFYSLPGLRLGYALAHPDRLAQWRQRRDPWAVNHLAAAVGAVVLEDQEFAQKTWQWLPPAREKLFQGLAGLPGLTPYPGAANFLLVETAVGSDLLQLDLLQTAQVLIRDCLSFPELGDRYFRVAVRTEAENQHLLTALTASLQRLTPNPHVP